MSTTEATTVASSAVAEEHHRASVSDRLGASSLTTRSHLESGSYRLRMIGELRPAECDGAVHHRTALKHPLLPRAVRDAATAMLLGLLAVLLPIPRGATVSASVRRPVMSRSHRVPARIRLLVRQ